MTSTTRPAVTAATTRNGGNSANGTRIKTVLSAVGPVEIEEPLDRDSSFDR